MDWAKKKERCYFLGMGDYDDFISSSERLIMGNHSLHDSTIETIEEWQERLTDRFYKEISFMQGRIIGLIEGNHFSTFQDGTTTTQRLCQKLGCKYLGCNSFIRLRFNISCEKNTPLLIDIFAHHGLGSARLTGASLNKVEQMMMVARADLYFQGHDHKKSVGMASILGLTNHTENVKLRSHNIVFARTGSFLRGYTPDKKSYVVDAGLTPTNLGVVKIEMTPKKSNDLDNPDTRKRFIDLHASI